MPTLTSINEAKEFLVDHIVREAKQEDVSLSETERKMLYFSETASTLPDIDQVNAEFERNYDQDEYQQKIGALVWNLRTRLKKEHPDELKTWKAQSVSSAKKITIYSSLLTLEAPHLHRTPQVQRRGHTLWGEVWY